VQEAGPPRQQHSHAARGTRARRSHTAFVRIILG
jgi:hypothetical protein